LFADLCSTINHIEFSNYIMATCDGNTSMAWLGQADFGWPYIYVDFCGLWGGQLLLDD
jgi:hypothetical protein